MLLGAKRPIIYAGGGVILGKASAQLTELAKMLNLPVTNTLMGLGCYPGSDRQFVGMLGMHGSYTANLAMHHSDVILAVGARFDDRVINGATKFCPNAKIIHIDIDPASISKTIKADIPIVGPVDSVLTEMVAIVKEIGQAPNAETVASWWKQIDEWRGNGRLFPTTRAMVRSSSRRPQSRCSARSPRARPMWHRTLVSIRCSPASTTSSTSPTAGSTRAASAPWASACRQPWG